jgi:hypothetical protein
MGSGIQRSRTHRNRWDPGHKETRGNVRSCDPESMAVSGALTASEQVEALLQSRNIPCTAHVFTGKKAWQDVLDAVLVYFSSGLQTAASRIHQTKLPPVFLQRPGHSITIVGIERLRKGKCRLLVFDPAYRPPAVLRERAEASPSLATAWLILWRYRRDEAYLKRYKSFEILFLDQVT